MCGSPERGRTTSSRADISKHKQPFSLLILITHICGSRDHINIEHAYSGYSLPKWDSIHRSRASTVFEHCRVLYLQATMAGSAPRLFELQFLRMSIEIGRTEAIWWYFFWCWIKNTMNLLLGQLINIWFHNKVRWFILETLIFEMFGRHTYFNFKNLFIKQGIRILILHFGKSKMEPFSR